jgi:hypothetical protein
MRQMIIGALVLPVFALAQQGGAASAPPQGGGRGAQGAVVVSPELRPDRHVVFRINAPQAQTVRLIGTDIPGNLQGAAMIKGENGVWEATLGPIDPGAYRYNFNVDRVSVIDPRNPPPANRITTRGACFTFPVRISWTSGVCRMAPWPAYPIIPEC